MSAAPEKRASWQKEFVLGLSTGVLYGTTSVIVGHPFDTVKTKMQAQSGYQAGGMLQSFSTVLKKEGIRGLYRGAIPPLCGSGVYRSTQFAVYEAVYTALKKEDIGSAPIPFSGGVETRVLLGGVTASFARSVIETPLEYIKVRRQIGKSWTFRGAYTGFGVTWMRMTGALTSFFVLVDAAKRSYPELTSAPLVGPFVTAGVCATAGWWMIWPLETLKSNVQGGNGGLVQSYKKLVESRGFLGLYRGILPGTCRSFLSNGASFVVMMQAQKWLTSAGFRDEDV